MSRSPWSLAPTLTCRRQENRRFALSPKGESFLPSVSLWAIPAQEASEVSSVFQSGWFSLCKLSTNSPTGWRLESESLPFCAVVGCVTIISEPEDKLLEHTLYLAYWVVPKRGTVARDLDSEPHRLGSSAAHGEAIGRGPGG